MKKSAIILTIGNEILSGDIHDENSYWIAKKLFSLGVELKFIFVIPDDKKIITEYIKNNRNKADFIFTVGGMGPTPDDVTKDAIAEAFNVRLIYNPKVIELVKAYHNQKEISEEKKLLTIFPQGSEIILTSDGSWAVGMITDNVFSFPGTPNLLKDSFPSIEHLLKADPIYKTKISINCEETHFADIMENMSKKYPEVEIGSYPSNKNFRDVKLIFKSRDINQIQLCRQDFVDKLTQRIPNLELS